MAEAFLRQAGADDPAPPSADDLRAMAKARLAEAYLVLDEQLGPNPDLARAIQRAGNDAAISALSGLVEDITALARAALGLSIYPVGSA